MGNSPVDRDKDYMYQMWGTTSLITDYWTQPTKSNKKVIQEIMHDDLDDDQQNLKESKD
jgi:hypothetical protein|tara:strand:+ start:132 stop:308 length:177 start_codon:yes stop_codon:yes gene_type:complete